ncbi:MAG: hypothetical protein ABS79_01550 [Planctomycetes bacterium SCN 63-9]|nr:MAG: hypothetical protein ABS79_01550 [Planctomycetes bacterium SCN 63-9]
MYFKAFQRTLLAMAILAGASTTARAGFVVDFDDVTAPAFLSDVTPGGDLGPDFTRFATFGGGVVINDSAYDNEATSKANLYATSDLHRLADNSSLPGVISAQFAPSFGVNGITLDIANGLSAGTFTLSAYGINNNLIDSVSIDLAAFGAGAGAVGTVSVFGSGITSFVVISNQRTGSVNFAIDTVRFLTAVPEPSSLVLCGIAGVAGLVALKRRRTV